MRNYSIFRISNIVKNKIRRGSDIPEYLFDFIAENGEVLGISNILNGEISYIKFRSLSEKKFLTYGVRRFIPYGIGDLLNFSFGDWLILVEGEKDRDSLKSVYPYVLATSTAGMGHVMREIILTLTNKFIIYYDNDEAGDKAFYRDRKFLLDNKCQVCRGIHPNGWKDSGTLVDSIFNGDMYNYSYGFDFYSNFIKSILGGDINVNKGV